MPKPEEQELQGNEHLPLYLILLEL
uniref:Germin-like protein subfamily 1 member 7 n=1 Tax=Rhizophora mucronata TaxID=61149 RepID=A0A2P2K2K6_RHIMU